ncbi:MAG: hypothetical protein JO335_05645 [Sphingomonas sp.]|nr:hypothetical protein [Sphingomonas sp.]
MPMLLIATTLLAAIPPERPAHAVASAIATIRIVRAVELKLDGSANEGAPAARLARLRAADGTTQQAKLIEFQ